MSDAMRRLTNKVRPPTVLIRDKRDKPITSIEGQIHRWKEYLEEILNPPTTGMESEEPTRLSTELPIICCVYDGPTYLFLHCSRHTTGMSHLKKKITNKY